MRGTLRRLAIGAPAALALATVTGSVIAGPPVLCGYDVEWVLDGPPCGIFPNAVMQPSQIRDGIAVGWYATCGFGADEAWRWGLPLGLQTLPRPAGSDGAGASAREGDVVVGWYFDGIRPQALLWDGGAMVELGTGPGGNWSRAQAISNGVVVGTWGNSTVAGLTEAFRWEGGQFEDLSPLIGGFRSFARDANAAGSIVGQRYPALGEPPIAYLLGGDELTLLGPLPGGFQSDASAINDAGEIVGSGQRIDEVTGEIVVRAFVWRDGVMQDLGTLPGFKHSAALDINDDGLIVGAVASPGSAPVIWINDRIIALEDLVGDPGELDHLGGARSVDEDGRVLIQASTDSTVGAILAPLETVPADLTCDGEVGEDDFEALLDSWGPCPAIGLCPGDLDGDGTVGIVDFLALLAGWT